MVKINIKQQILLITILIGVFGIVIAITIIIPSIKEILNLKQSITETQKFLEQQYEKTQRMRRSVHNLDNIAEQTNKFKDITIQEGDELFIITELEKLASTYGIEQNLRVEKTDTKENKGALSEEEKKLPVILKKQPYYTFSFSNIGAFENHLRYLRALEQMPYYLNIYSLQFDKKTKNGLIDLRFNAKIYVAEH